MPTPARVCGLAGLVVVNLLVLGLLLFLVDICLPSLRSATSGTLMLQWAYGNVESVLIGQMLILGYVVALGGAPLPVRLILASVCVGLVYGILLLNRVGTSDVSEFGFWTPLDYWAEYGGQVVVACLLLRGLRSWGGWCLQWNDSSPRVASWQFSIVHLLAWTTAIAFPLGILQTVFAHRRWELVVEVLIKFAWSLPVSIPAFCWAIRPGSPRQKWLWLTTIGVAILSAWPIAFFGYVYVTNGRGALPPWWIFPLVMAMTFTYFMTLLLVLIGNVLWMERLGLIVRKPVARSGGATGMESPPVAPIGDSVLERE